MTAVPGPLFTQPKSKLVFNGPFVGGDMNCNMMKVMNQNNEHVAFSVTARCNEGELLHCYPPNGVLEAGQAMELAVTRSWRPGPIHPPPEGADRLVVDWVNVPEGHAGLPWSRAWFSRNDCMVRKKTIDIGYNE